MLKSKVETEVLHSQDVRLPQWAAQLLSLCPTAGSGVHRWLFTTALKLHRLHLSHDVMESLLADATQTCGREVTSREIEEAVRHSSPQVEDGSSAPKQFRRPIVPNQKAIQSVLSDRRSLAELQALSPVVWNDDAPHTEEVIDLLFPGNPLICAGPSNTFTITQTREAWRERLSKQQFIVPNSMSKVWGKTKDGKRTMRSLDNVGLRRFVVVEFDSGSFDEQATIHLHLAKLAPLVLAVSSGGKSIHAWFFRKKASDDALKKFFDYAVSLGADPATWTACQLVRMPDGQRDSGRRQSIVFVNPKPMEDK